MKRLVVRVVLALFIYNSSVWLIGKLTFAVSYLLAKSGAPELWSLLAEHPFAKSIAVGIGAGLIPFELWLTLSGLIRAEVPKFLRELELDQLKRWLVVIYSPVLALAALAWVHDWSEMNSKNRSVFQFSSPMPVSHMFDGFFATNCGIVYDNRLSLWPDNFYFHCSFHVLMISTFLMAAGYSLTPSIISALPSRGDNAPPVTGNVAHDEVEPTNSVSSNEQTL